MGVRMDERVPGCAVSTIAETPARRLHWRLPMRPPEIDVVFVLHHLDCSATEDTKWDEPYLWHLGFKVDADTLGPPPPGSTLGVPSLEVEVFEGGPSLPFVVGPRSVQSGDSVEIARALGTRGFRLKPAFIPMMNGWFPGLAGTLCLLWDQDGFAPSTAEVGYKKFKALFGPATTTELNRMVAGDYDEELATDANGVKVPDGPEGRNLPWRFSRLADPGGRKHAVKAMTRNIKDGIIQAVTATVVLEAGLDELIDRDDLLGAEAQVYLGNELGGPADYSLRFTDEGADYTARGFVSASQVHRTVLDATITRIDRRPDKAIGLWLGVCQGPVKLYWAEAFRVQTTQRYTLRATLGEAPAVVRWFIDDRPLPDGDSVLPVVFEPTAKTFGPPQDGLAKDFPGGPAPINCRVTGPVLEVWNEGGDGVFFGNVRALYAFPGDPSLFFHAPIDELFARGYDRSADLDIVAVKLEMNDDYRHDVGECMKLAPGIDREWVSSDFRKLKIDPGDHPEWRQVLADRLAMDIRVVGAVGLEAPSGEALRRLIAKRRLLTRQ